MNKKIMFMIFSFLSVFFIGVQETKAEEKIINLDYDSEKLKSYLSANQSGLEEIDNYWSNQMPYTDEDGNTYNNYAIKFVNFESRTSSSYYTNEIVVMLYNGDDLYLNSYYRSGYSSRISITNSYSSSDFEGSTLAFYYRSNSSIQLSDIKSDTNSSFGSERQLTYYGNLSYGDLTFPINYFEDYFEPRWSGDVINFSFIYNTNSNFLYKKGSYDFDIRYNSESFEDKEEVPLIKKIVNPKIAFSVKNNTETIDGEEYITSKDLTVDFGYIDNTKYMYQISLDDGENWQTYTLTQSTSITLEITNNLTVIARVLEIEDNSYVTSSTFTITDIVSSNFVKLEDYSSNTDYCFETINGKKYQVCFNLVATFSKIDNDKYNYFISDETGSNFSKITDMENTTSSYMKSFNLFKNGNYIVKIEDKNGNYINSATMTLTFANEIEQLGQKVVLSYEFDKQGHCEDGSSISICSTAKIYALFLNTDISKYNYYYSVDRGKTWILINEYVKNGDFYMYETQENTVFIAKIEDKNGNYIDSATIQVDYASLLEDTNPLKKIFDFVKDYIYKKLPIIEQLGDIYDSFQYVAEDGPPTYTFDLSFLNLGKHSFEFSFYDKYRDILFDYIKIFFSIYTVLAIIEEVKNIIGGGN